MKEKLKDLGIVVGVLGVFVLFVFFILSNIVNWLWCFKYWNTPMTETPARCINSNK